MTITRLLLSFSRPALLALALLLTVGAAQAAQVDSFFKIQSNPDENALIAFEIHPFDEEPFAGMLVPAIQAARVNFATMACDGSVLPELEIVVSRRNKPGTSTSYKLKDVLITSYSLRAGAGNGSALGQDGNDSLIVNNGDGSDFQIREHVLLSYTGLEMTDSGTGETLVFDCSTGRCECVPSR